jgi:biotin carboxylase
MGNILFAQPKGHVLELMKYAKSKGHRTIAVCMSGSAAVLDGSHMRDGIEVVEVSSWELGESVAELLQKLEVMGIDRIDGVYTGTDACVLYVAELRGRCGLPTATSESLALVLDKYQMRAALTQSNLSSLDSWASTDAWSLSKKIQSKSVYFKPRTGHGSGYVARCDNSEQVASAWQNWSTNAAKFEKWEYDHFFKNGYFLEFAIDGELLSVEIFFWKGEPTVIGLTSRILLSADPTIEMGSCFPYEHPLKNKIVSKAIEAHRVLGLDYGFTHTEFIVSANGEIEIIDLNPRFVGADVFRSINFAYDTCIEEKLLLWSMGLRPTLRLHPKRTCCLQYLMLPEGVEFRHIDFPIHPNLVFKASFLKPGYRASGVYRYIDYAGCYLVVGKKREEAEATSFSLRSEILINGKTKGVY